MMLVQVAEGNPVTSAAFVSAPGYYETSTELLFLLAADLRMNSLCVRSQCGRKETALLGRGETMTNMHSVYFGCYI